MLILLRKMLVGFTGNDENSDNELIEKINQNIQNENVESEFDEIDEGHDKENIKNNMNMKIADLVRVKII